MGYGSYSASDWQKLKSSRKLSNGQRVEEVFTRRECDPVTNSRPSPDNDNDPYKKGLDSCHLP